MEYSEEVRGVFEEAAECQIDVLEGEKRFIILLTFAHIVPLAGGLYWIKNALLSSVEYPGQPWLWILPVRTASE